MFITGHPLHIYQHMLSFCCCCCFFPYWISTTSIKAIALLFLPVITCIRVGTFFTIMLQEDSKLSNLLNQPIAYVISVNIIVLQRQLYSWLHAMPVLSAQPLYSILHYRGSCIAGYMLSLFLVLSHCILSYTTEVVV